MAVTVYEYGSMFNHGSFVFILAIYINMNAVSQQEPQLEFSHATRAHLRVGNEKNDSFPLSEPSTLTIIMFLLAAEAVVRPPELKEIFHSQLGWGWGQGVESGSQQTQSLLAEHVNK